MLLVLLGTGLVCCAAKAEAAAVVLLQIQLSLLAWAAVVAGMGCCANDRMARSLTLCGLSARPADDSGCLWSVYAVWAQIQLAENCY